MPEAFEFSALARLPAWSWGALILTLLYAGFYLGDPATPGNNFDPCCITGWIGWTDQGLYYASAAALEAGNLDPGRHWYPLGYALLAAPFGVLKSHRFFLVDLAGLLVAYAAFVAFARRIGVSPAMAVILFLASVCLDTTIFQQWAIPWSTTPAAATIWLLLAVAAAHIAGRRNPFLLGLLAGLLPLFRPTDVIISAICLLGVAISDWRGARHGWGDAALAAAGAALPMAPYAALHLAIYGPHASNYMINSRAIGFTAHNLAWRAYVLLIDPRRWFFAGEGLLRHAPWLILGFAGVPAGWRRGGPVALLASCLFAYLMLMILYVDLLPTGLWRYYNIHYFKWMFPGFGLLAWLLLRDLWDRDRFAWGALAVVLALSCVRISPRPVGPDEPALAVDIPGPVATEANSTMAPALAAADAVGDLPNVTMMRAFPLPTEDGVRLIGLRRDISGGLRWLDGRGLPMPANPPPQRRWGERITLGYPCWLPPHPCKK